MPLFTFRCKRCGTEQDFLQKIEEPDPVCPECENSVMEKVITAPATFKLKGAGFYNPSVEDE